MTRTSAGFSKDSETVLSGLLRAGDVLAVAISALVAYALRAGNLDLPGTYISATVLGMLLTANYMHFAGVYSLASLRRQAVEVAKVVAAWVAVFATLVVVSIVTDTSELFARSWLSLWFSFSLGGFLLLRAFAALQIDRWLKSGRLALKVGVVGHGELARQVDRQLRQLGEQNLRIVGFYDPGEREQEAAQGLEHGRIRGGIARLVEDIQHGEVEEVVVAMPWSQERRIREILKTLAALSINVRICPDVFTLYLPLRGMTSAAGVAFLDVFERPLSGWDLVLKNLEDRILAPLICLVFLIPGLLIALAIKLDSRGPVLFRQQRFGFNNNPINVLKFRTMYVDRPPEQGVPQATRNDPRVTRVGRILRRTSLDELPQLWNVLKGEMSLVGPRPHAVDHNYKYAAMIDEYLGRHRMKPGMTGWAQVNGLRGETQTAEQMRARVQYDLSYIDNWSLWFDLRILFLTLFVGFVHRRAY
ncbi:MAG TPA: undecaprenyl-phosphate glucose phosphotransferase [Dongiaceae bacterium]|nr:undecaprenyl-phosphate glucose phosphotransferase [Dongiaceae bacterium]